MNTYDASSFPGRYFGPGGANLPSMQDIAQMRRSFKREIIAFIEQLPENSHVLDLGCGAGKTMRLMLALRPDLKISGIDISDLSASVPQEISFTQGALEDLPKYYPEGAFDAVICQHVIEHLVYPLALMQGIEHVLKPGGECFIETPNWTRLFIPFSNIYFWNDYTHIRPFSRGAMHRLLDEHGFVIRSIRTLSSSKWFPPRPAAHASKAIAQHKISHSVPPRGTIARIAARVINPLTRDVLIAIARKR